MLHCQQACEHRRNSLWLLAWFVFAMAASAILFANSEASAQTKQPPIVLNINPPHVSTDKSIKYDYDIVYVRAPRYGDEKFARFAEVFNPMAIDSGADLVLLKPDGSEEVLVEAGNGAVADPYVSFDGNWVFYALLHGGISARRVRHLQDPSSHAQDRAAHSSGAYAEHRHPFGEGSRESTGVQPGPLPCSRG